MGERYRTREVGGCRISHHRFSAKPVPISENVITDRCARHTWTDYILRCAGFLETNQEQFIIHREEPPPTPKKRGKEVILYPNVNLDQRYYNLTPQQLAEMLRNTVKQFQEALMEIDAIDAKLQQEVREVEEGHKRLRKAHLIHACTMAEPVTDQQTTAPPAVSSDEEIVVRRRSRTHKKAASPKRKKKEAIAASATNDVPGEFRVKPMDISTVLKTEELEKRKIEILDMCKELQQKAKSLDIIFSSQLQSIVAFVTEIAGKSGKELLPETVASSLQPHISLLRLPMPDAE